ncbi:hypothetical protein [Blastopirellula marina]|uniref:Uncharacterized protein n=1 Tax=Blastopirellula marina TaxID=124 RepID=A0A2S8F4C8_9BACT|nr:hypothetical protein [Blastopirellula marina]PQO27025.1 hypothetical protein C5Y98_27595 [Blastopirellula marina]PTL41172.1 hypothetical protein C5Y97_27610 [Blastopirellula marina]
MPSIATQLETLRKQFEDSYDPRMPFQLIDRLVVAKIGDLFHLAYYGTPVEGNYVALLETIARPEIAPYIGALSFAGPDEGANGTRNWDLTPLVSTDAVFSQLKSFTLPLRQPGEHYQTIVAEIYDEEGVIAKLLNKAPQINHLAVPSSPNEEFFEREHHCLERLQVDAGYDPQNFIANLAASTCFPKLACLEWGEYNVTEMDNYPEACTPLKHYHQLFRAPAMDPVTSFVWRNPVCSREEIKQLAEMRPELSILVVRFSEEYI